MRRRLRWFGIYWWWYVQRPLLHARRRREGRRALKAAQRNLRPVTVREYADTANRTHT